MEINIGADVYVQVADLRLFWEQQLGLVLLSSFMKKLGLC